MSLERALAVGAATLLVAGAAAGVGLAATGHGATAGAAPVRRLELHGTTRAAFIRATASYLGVSVATLRRDIAGGRTLAEVASSTPGHSERQLAALLVAAVAPQVEQIADMALSRVQMRGVEAMLRRRIVGFLDDTCPLSLGGLEHLGGCAGMAA